MPYIIDGNNLIGASPDIALTDPDRRGKLIDLLRRFQESRNSKLILVFDGDPGESSRRQSITHKFEVLFPEYGSSADDVIKKLLDGYGNLQDVVLVTSDIALKKHAREQGARTVNSIEFYHELRKASSQQKRREETQKRIDSSPSQGEVEAWLKIFGTEP